MPTHYQNQVRVSQCEHETSEGSPKLAQGDMTSGAAGSESMKLDESRRPKLDTNRPLVVMVVPFGAVWSWDLERRASGRCMRCIYRDQSRRLSPAMLEHTLTVHDALLLHLLYKVLPRLCSSFGMAPVCEYRPMLRRRYRE